MKLTGRIFVFHFLFVVISSCSNPPEELQKVESLIESKPDSALHILRNISTEKYKSDENKALYGLLMIEALDRLKLPMLPESLLDFSFNYYQKHPDPVRLANCYLYKGRRFKYSLQYDKATNSYVQGLDLIENKNEYMLSARLNFDMADICRYQKEFAKARQKYIKAYNFYLKANSVYFATTTLLSFGITYSDEKQYKEAQKCFYRVYFHTKDSLIKGLAIQNLGINYYALKQYDSALNYLRKSLSFPYIQTNMAIRYYYLADLYFDLNQFDSAALYANKSFNYNPDIITSRECYRILVNTANVKGDIRGLKKSMVNYQNCIDSLRKIDAQPKGSYIENLHHTKAESYQNKLKLWFAICLLCMAVLLGYWLIIKIKRHSKIAIKQTEEKHIIHKAEIRKEPVLKKRKALKDKIEKIKTEKIQEKRPISIAERELQVRNIYEHLLHLNDTEFFFHEMNTLFNDLITKLKSRYPGLNDKELLWCCLYLLEVPTHDMLILLEYKTDNSLKRMKNRLSEKVCIENAGLLGDLLFKIISED
jgi:tetratricopeptide (TPR) repeat protein